MKQNKPLFTAVCVFAVLGVLVWLLSFLGHISDERRPVTITLSDRAAAVLSQVQIKNDSGSYTVSLSDGIYHCPELSGLPCSQQAFDLLAQGCTQIVATSNLHISEEQDLGFDRPHAQVDIVYIDDTIINLTIGAQDEDSGGYFLRLSENGPVYLLSQEDASLFLQDVTCYMSLELVNNTSESETFPEQIHFSNQNGRFDISLLPHPFVDGAGNLLEYTVSSSDGRSGYADTESLTACFFSLNTLQAGRVVQLTPTPEELVSYGLTNQSGDWVHPLYYTINGEETRLALGNRSGDYYYICKEGIDAVYTLPIAQMGWENADYFALMNRNLFAPNMEEVAQIEAVVRTENGTDKYVFQLDGTTAVCNGISLSDRDFSEIYQLLISFEAEYEMEDPAENILPELTLTFTMNPEEEDAKAQTHTVRFIPYGLRRHAIEVDGEARYAIRSSYVQTVAAGLSAIVQGQAVASGW